MQAACSSQMRRRKTDSAPQYALDKPELGFESGRSAQQLHAAVRQVELRGFFPGRRHDVLDRVAEYFLPEQPPLQLLLRLGLAHGANSVLKPHHVAVAAFKFDCGLEGPLHHRLPLILVWKHSIANILRKGYGPKPGIFCGKE